MSPPPTNQGCAASQGFGGGCGYWARLHRRKPEYARGVYQFRCDHLRRTTSQIRPDFRQLPHLLALSRDLAGRRCWARWGQLENVLINTSRLQNSNASSAARGNATDRQTGIMLTGSTDRMKGSKSVLSHADYSYPMNHRPLWISNFTEPSSRILNRSDWQDSSFETLARLMISKTLSGFSRRALRIFSRSRINRLLRFCMLVWHGL
jgi:hypothetical protein